MSARYRGSEDFLVSLLYPSGVVPASAKHLAILDYQFLGLVFMTIGMNQTFY